MSQAERENPYNTKRPAAVSVFVGRKKLLQQLTEDLVVGRCFEITGGPGIGKTSLLQAVQRGVIAIHDVNSLSTTPLPVYVECRRSQATVEDVLAVMVRGLTEALLEQRHLLCPITEFNKAKSEAERGRLDIALSVLLEWAFRREKCTHLPILLIDDLHRLNDKSCLQPLASVLHTSVNRQQIGLALASQQSLVGELRDDVSLLRMLISQRHQLGPLNLDETQALADKAVDLGWEVEDGCGDLAYRLTDGHPYRLHYYFYGALSVEKKLTISGLNALHTPENQQHLSELIGNNFQSERKALPTVFISYSRRDEVEKDKLLSHLGVLRKAGLIEVWSDDQIKAGVDWQNDINQTIARATVAILLISADFLNSEFILGTELPVLLKRREDAGLIIFPIIAKDCAWDKVAWLANMNVRPKGGKPIWDDAGNHVDKDLAGITREISVMLNT
jgi:TIR domain-containing protein/conflict system STAND superfamily ATPase